MSEITPILHQRDTRPLMVKLMVPWYFYTWVDKGVLVFFGFMTIYAIIRILFTGFW